MTTEEHALRVFREMARFNYPAALERRSSDGKRTPANYAVCVKASDLGTDEISRIAKLARKEDVRLSVQVSGKKPFLVLA